MRRKRCPAARILRAELHVDQLEHRRARLISRRQRVPHKLMAQLASARLKALRA
jgi:hypothetical protein